MGFLLFFRVSLCPGQGQEDFFQASAVRGQLLQGAGGRQFAFGKDEHLLTDRLHLAEDMAGQNDGVGLAQLPDEFTHFDHLRRVQAHGRLVQNDDLWATQQSLRNAHPLFIALGQAADEPGQHFFQPRPPGGTEHLLLALGTRDFFELCHKVQVLPHRHFRVEGRLLRQIAHAGLGLVGILRQRVPRNGMKAAIIGAGPAGLTIAVLLARWGYDITIFDARDKIGGVMRYGIPNYRLPDSVLDDFAYRHLELKGIKVRTNTAIGRTITIDDLFRDGYKSVFIGAGLWKANAMHIKGETLGNVAFGIDYLANSKAFRLGNDIAVIGVGNSAMDCARTAIRNGARHVTCYARRDESCISASEYEVSYAKLEGVGFRFCKAPVEIRENGLICRDTVKGEDGRFTQVEGSETFYPHTGVIVSVSQGSESNLVKTTTGIETNQKGLLTVSEDGSTTREGVFAGGDAVMGARTVVEAVAVAKKVAESMDAYMKSLPAEEVADPYANIPVFQTPTSDVLAKQEI